MKSCVLLGLESVGAAVLWVRFFGSRSVAEGLSRCLEAKCWLALADQEGNAHNANRLLL